MTLETLLNELNRGLCATTPEITGVFVDGKNIKYVTHHNGYIELHTGDEKEE